MWFDLLVIKVLKILGVNYVYFVINLELRKLRFPIEVMNKVCGLKIYMYKSVTQK